MSEFDAITPPSTPPKQASKGAGKEPKKGVAAPTRVNRVREAAAALAAAGAVNGDVGALVQ